MYLTTTGVSLYFGHPGAAPPDLRGHQPSTAAPDDLDNTLKSVERVALHNGFDSFLMFNVYAQRATRPDDMEPECNLALHRENMRAFDYALSWTRRAIPPCGPPGAPSLKSETTCQPASGT